MKTGMKASIIVATVLTGTLVAEAQQQRQNQQRVKETSKRQCPNCGWSPNRQQQRSHQGQINQQRRQGRRETAQFQGTPQQNKNKIRRPQQRQQPIQPQQGRRTAQYQPRQGQMNQQRPHGQRNTQIQKPQLQNRSPAQKGRNNAQIQSRKKQVRRQQNPQMQQKRQQILKRFDADGNGQLSEQERSEMKKAWKKHQKNRSEGSPKNPPVATE